MKRKTRRKPRGALGGVTTTRAGQPYYQPLELPETKEELERFMVAGALRAARKMGPDPYDLIGDPVQNPEANLDFTLPTARGSHYLELMELVFLPDGAKSYDDGRFDYDGENMAEAVFARIKRKSKRYGVPRKSSHLLLYATDFRFQIGGVVAELLTIFLARRPHAFATVAYFSPDTLEDGQFRLLFPVNDDVRLRYEREQQAIKSAGQRHWIICPDLRRFRAHGDGGVIFDSLAVSKERQQQEQAARGKKKG